MADVMFAHQLQDVICRLRSKIMSFVPIHGMVGNGWEEVFEKAGAILAQGQGSFPKGCMRYAIGRRAARKMFRSAVWACADWPSGLAGSLETTTWDKPEEYIRDFETETVNLPDLSSTLRNCCKCFTMYASCTSLQISLFHILPEA